ncbi:hypothetical protein GQ53DRAFT_843200 [Thozetella sp. PMI_491]|nr:hypothetical protein GQ53DRAFT_843200 [Thozetella sp. PMI_491]
MAAMFESVNRDSAFVPTPTQKVNLWGDSKPSGIFAPYTVNVSPSATPTRSTRSTRSDSMQYSKAPNMLNQGDQSTEGLLMSNTTPPSREKSVKVLDTSTQNKLTPHRGAQVSSGGEIATSAALFSRPGKDGTPTRSEKFAGVTLKKLRGTERPLSRESTFEQEDKAPLSLGRMTPHQQEPDVARHIHFSRPPSATTFLKDKETPSFEALLEVHPSASPGAQSGNSLLHAQIRNLQKHLDARTEEVKQLRRQLETKANLDLGTLSEQLRQAKRECRMWRERAEAAEKRVAVFERFTAKIRRLKERSSEDESVATSLPVTARMMKVPEEEDPCNEIMEDRAKRSSQRDSSPHTEDEEVVRERIRKSFQRMDGGESSDFGSGVYQSEDDDDQEEQENTRALTFRRRAEVPLAAASAWMAAQELLEHEDMRNWLAGPP